MALSVQIGYIVPWACERYCVWIWLASLLGRPTGDQSDLEREVKTGIQTVSGKSC